MRAHTQTAETHRNLVLRHVHRGGRRQHSVTAPRGRSVRLFIYFCFCLHLETTATARIGQRVTRR